MEKCPFAVMVGKFLGIIPNIDRHKRKPRQVRGDHQNGSTDHEETKMDLNGMLTTLNRLISRSTNHALPF